MKIYFAPLEGITGYIYRRAYDECYGKGKIDKYFIPFIAPNKNGSFTSMNMNNISPDNNIGINAIPQVLTSNAQQFIYTAIMLKDMGYTQINLNLGCPSPTVVTKGKGAGFLSDTDKLNSFFENVFSSGLFQEDNNNVGKLSLSVKTRIGVNDVNEVYELFKVYNNFYFDEIIVHPRIQKEYYKGLPHIDIYKELITLSKNRLCYNSDIFTKNDYIKFINEFSEEQSIMLGRGLIADPAFIDVISHIKCDSNNEYERDINFDMTRLKKFHNILLEDYSQVMSGDINVLHKMKELWFYMAKTFCDCEKPLKQIKKSKNMADYKAAVDMIFSKGKLCEKEHITFG